MRHVQATLNAAHTAFTANKLIAASQETQMWLEAVPYKTHTNGPIPQKPTSLLFN